jgi:hypothetical protein
MAWLYFMLGGLGVMVLSYLLTIFYMRRNHGIQPRYTGLLIIVTTVGCLVPAFYILRRFGLDLQHGPARDIFWLALSILWLVSAVWTVYYRQMSGTVLMDLGPASMFKLQMGLSVLLGVVAIGLAIDSGSRAKAFAYGAWSAWFFVMARGRFEVRDRGVITAAQLLPWNRIAGCVATADNKVRLNLNKGLQRTVDIRLPADRRDGFIQLVNARKGVNPDPIDPHLSNT